LWRQLNWLLGVRIGCLQHHAPRRLKIPARYHQPAPLARPITISIVTPSLNQGEFLERTVRSVLVQRFHRLEYVIQDGGSTDSTLEVLERYRPHCTHCESRRDRGQAHAINLGLARTSGEIMAYLNSDDLLLPGALHFVARYFSLHPDVDVVYGHRILIDEEDKEIGRWVLPPHDDRTLLWADFVPQESLFWRRRAWERVGGALDESLQFAMDWEFLLRLRQSGARMVRLPRFLGAFRVHGRAKSVTQTGTLGLKEMTHLRRRTFGRDVSASEIRRGILAYTTKQALYHRSYQLGVLRH
jgi:GT2 family glycosyltransferase